ncbi:MAG: hypothetical protein WBV06_14835 [Acidimicrobiia bacterium]|jgi:hypothetical protein
MGSSENLAQLRRISERMRSINDQVSQRLVSSSCAPDLMETAYAAIRGEVPGSDGMTALRDALSADGVAEMHLDAIEALYVRCLLDPTI